MLRADQLLYIYYLKGRLPRDAITPGSRYIGNWEDDGFSFLFFSEPSRDTVQKIVELHAQMVLIDEFRMSYAQWQDVVFTHLKTAGFLILRQREDCGINGVDGDGLIPILIDPGVVFGSGTHPTTRACLEAVALTVKQEVPRMTLDLGTGTGILSIAAALVGSKRSLAVDSNFLAVKTACGNIRLNGLEDRILAVQGRAENFIDTCADLLIANIDYEVLHRLIGTEGFLRKRFFIVSGLLRSQAQDMVYRLARLPVTILQKWEHDHIWHTIYGKLNR